MLRSLGITSDRSLVRFLNNFGTGLFEKIPDHSWFNRKSKNLLPTFEEFRKDLLGKLNVENVTKPILLSRCNNLTVINSEKVTFCCHNDPKLMVLLYVLENNLIRIIDSTPVPVVRYRRGEGRLAKSFERANFGYCATQDEKYFGFKLHLLTTSTGIPTHFDFTEASLPDVKMLEELISSFNKLIVIGDKGYHDFDLKDKLLTEHKLMITPDKKNQRRQLNNQAKKQFLKLRKRIEITINQLEDQFNLTKLRAKSTLGLTVRIMGLMLTMTLAVFINRLLGRPDFKIKELLL